MQFTFFKYRIRCVDSRRQDRDREALHGNGDDAKMVVRDNAPVGGR